MTTAKEPPTPLSSNRCQFTFSDGRQCRMQQAHFCAQHSLKQKHGAKREHDASALEALCADLTTTTSINRVLAQTFLLLAQGRISRKDAVAFGYLSQLLLQSVAGVRAEYVSAFGYPQWEEKLQASLAPNPDDDPGPSPDDGSGPSGGGNENAGHDGNGVVGRQKGMSIRPLLPHKKDERGIPPKPFPVNKSADVEPSTSGQPDFADLYRRGRNLVERKYDFTPEGRHEAQKLALELELMKPAPSKPPRDHFGRVVEYVRLLRDYHEGNVAGDTDAPSFSAANYYGHPIQSDHPTRMVIPRDKPQRGISHPAMAPATAIPSVADDPSEPPPIPAVPHESAGGPDADHHEGHRTDWYAPPSWSGIRPPDPCPSRKEKLQRKLRGMSNSAFRRLQHRNSRGY